MIPKLIPQAYRDLKSYLGRQNAFIELQELAFREIIQQSKDHSDSPKAYFDAMHRKHGIYTNLPDADRVRHELGRLYVLLAFGAVERFLAEFGGEVTSPDMETWPKPHFELIKALQVIRSKFTGDERNECLLELIEYYRLVRNEAAHPYDSSQHIGELKAQHPKLCTDPFRQFLTNQYGHGVPPSVSYQLTFEDFILCSRVCKDFALAVCKVFQPDIERCVIKLQKEWRIRFSNLTASENPQRLRNKQIGELKTKFGLDEKEALYILESMKGF